MVILFDDLLFDPERWQLVRRGVPVALSPKAFELLGILIEQRPRVVPKQELIDRLWPDVIVEEANVRNLIAEIRRATAGADPPPIRTAHRVGYAFVAPASEIHPERRTAHLAGPNRSWMLVEGLNMIGRDPTCIVRLDTSGVSRRHAVIRLASGHATLADLRSKNGTWLNGRRIESAELADGDGIRIGLAELTFRTSAEDANTDSVEDP